MNRLFAFLFFLLFLAGFALVSLNNMKKEPPAKPGANLSSGPWQDALSSAHVKFSVAGEVSGYSGCNRFFGSFVATDSTISIGPLGGTRMACANDAGENERRFLAALSAASGYRISGDTLHLVNAGGDESTLRLVDPAALAD